MNRQQAARRMLNELESSDLEVCEIPGSNGGYIRVPISVNLQWYRRFCAQYQTTRRRHPKPRTIIRRCHTIAALRRIIAGNRSGVYAGRLISLIDEYVLDKTKRICLRCGKRFPSTGPGNRICSKCAKINSDIYILPAQRKIPTQ